MYEDVCRNFNPRSLAGATFNSPKYGSIVTLFQSTLPRGSDIAAKCLCTAGINNFNPRSLAGATVHGVQAGCKAVQFQSTLPRGSDKNRRCLAAVHRDISIHAPSRERQIVSKQYQTHKKISIHAPSRERHEYRKYHANQQLFQSTLPRGSDMHFVARWQAVFVISIHAPSRERQLAAWPICASSRKFQSTLPRGSDRFAVALACIILLISIHAPSRERHWRRGQYAPAVANFNPRSLAGATRKN